MLRTYPVTLFLFGVILSVIFLVWASEFEVFPLSTEMQIGKIRNLVERAPEGGLYVAVGGERAFRSSSMYASIDHLIRTYA